MVNCILTQDLSNVVRKGNMEDVFITHTIDIEVLPHPNGDWVKITTAATVNDIYKMLQDRTNWLVFKSRNIKFNANLLPYLNGNESRIAYAIRFPDGSTYNAGTRSFDDTENPIGFTEWRREYYGSF